jgi:nucleotide-binding universal stress UspA family protein
MAKVHWAITPQSADDCTAESSPTISPILRPPTDTAPHLEATFTGEQTVPAPMCMKRLLVPLDGTAEAERTLPYASMMARLLHAHLTLGHVTPTTGPGNLAKALHVAGSDQLTTQQVFEPGALPYLQNLRWRLILPPERIHIHHISAPSVVDGLLELVEADNISLITLGLRSHSDTDHFRLGTVVDSLIRNCTTPVLLIPPNISADCSLFTLRHILVPVDGSALAEEALAPLLGLLDQSQGSAGEPLAVTLLRVAENKSKVPECQSYLEALQAVLVQMPVCSRVQVRTEVIIGSAPGAIVDRIGRGARREEVSDTCPAGQVDLLIMATHGRRGIERLVLGSVADYVTPRIHVPVLLVRPRYLHV